MSSAGDPIRAQALKMQRDIDAAPAKAQEQSKRIAQRRAMDILRRTGRKVVVVNGGVR